ncbi:MAG: NUDIX domain-containing protein [Deltaproteobacteria bacterium]|nr:NUDIX domain-containing protein [Deltaproteobacteria bacterium]
MNPRIPHVGVGVIIIREGFVLLGRRIGSLGAETWALPGGHLEFGESIEDCAVREVLEETGLALEAIAQGPYSNNFFPAEEKHYVTLFITARCPTGKPLVLEPDKCSTWQWFRWSELPQPLFPPLASLVRSGYVPHDAP